MNTTRRKAIKNIMLASTLCSTSPLLFCEKEDRHQLQNIGFISGILRKELQTDWKSALKQAVEYGFTEYEGGSLGESPGEFLAFCRDIGLKPIAGGLQMSEDMDAVRKDLDRLATLEMEYAVIYWPWFIGGPFQLEDCKRSADVLNKIGALVQEYGLTLCWHNHDKEFQKMERGLPFHYLMNATDKELVKCELDIYWVAKGGADPLHILEQYAGRIPILHVKDMVEGEAQDFACPGSGIIDFPSIFAEAYRQGIKHYFVERDNVPDGMACLKSSSEYLKSLYF